MPSLLRLNDTNARLPTDICALVQTVQYIQPKHHARLTAAELLIIDEAAAIPLPLVQAMLGPYLVFLCSTVNGYEGAPHHTPLHIRAVLLYDSIRTVQS
jgi:N-acetyltransferase 10